jgi:F-type H+-transporting ATPase subunit a
MSSINACLGVASCTYILLLYNSIKYRGVLKGIGNALKEITVPISMTFRLFGSILSGFLIMAIVYYYAFLRIAVPAALSVMFIWASWV